MGLGFLHAPVVDRGSQLGELLPTTVPLLGDILLCLLDNGLTYPVFLLLRCCLAHEGDSFRDPPSQGITVAQACLRKRRPRRSHSLSWCVVAVLSWRDSLLSCCPLVTTINRHSFAGYLRRAGKQECYSSRTFEHCIACETLGAPEYQGSSWKLVIPRNTWTLPYLLQLSIC